MMTYGRSEESSVCQKRNCSNISFLLVCLRCSASIQNRDKDQADNNTVMLMLLYFMQLPKRNRNVNVVIYQELKSVSWCCCYQTDIVQVLQGQIKWLFTFSGQKIHHFLGFSGIVKLFYLPAVLKHICWRQSPML